MKNEGYGLAIHSLDATPGQSGCPLLRVNKNGKYENFGIHMGVTKIAGEDIPDDEYYTGALITKNVYTWI